MGGVKKYIPKELSCKHSGSRNLNQKVREYIYSFVWRHNVTKDTRLDQLGNLVRNCQWIWVKLHFRFFCVWEKKLRKLTIVNAWKWYKNNVKTNEFKRWPKMRYVHSAARVAETQTEAVSKGVNSAGPLGAAWPCFFPWETQCWTKNTSWVSQLPLRILESKKYPFCFWHFTVAFCLSWGDTPKKTKDERLFWRWDLCA